MKMYFEPTTEVIEGIMQDALCGQQGSPIKSKPVVPDSGFDPDANPMPE